MTTTTAEATAADEPDALFCYRHPDRETWVRCGRCERPICTRCAMQGPVGMRCRTCGRPKNDPLTRLSPPQLAGGSVAAVVAGTVGGYVGLEFGPLFAILLGPIVGGVIAEVVLRVTGYKRGPVIQAIVFGGIIVGVVLAAGIQYQGIVSMLEAVEGFDPGLGGYLRGVASGGIVYAAAAVIGAYSRLR
jgi:hypothetical protein